MTIKIGINGLGRIGRCVFRAVFENNYNEKIELVAANGSAPISQQLHLLKYDSIHGRFPFDLDIDGDKIVVTKNNKQYQIRIIAKREPAEIDWSSLGVDIVLECTGAFTSNKDASKHIAGGAKRVLISAPAKESTVKTIIYGVNHNRLKPEDNVISVGSCTTNCLAPVAKVLNDKIGIIKGMMTTIHAYTNDQNILDGSHKDMGRARAANLSMVPTSTGAAKAIGLVLPELAGKLDGSAIRVPVPNVSMVDLTFLAARNVTIEEIHHHIAEAAAGEMLGVLAIEKARLVSVDFNHTPISSWFDATQTNVIGGDFVKVAAWYDNEWAFSCRMLDVSCLA